MTFPAHEQMLLPLVQAIADNGGRSTRAQVAAHLADHFQLTEEQRNTIRKYSNGRRYNVWRNRVAWVRQEAVAKGLLETGTPRNDWRLSGKGKQTLENIRPGIIVTVFETHQGEALWACAETASAAVKDDALKLILTSPPYPLVSPKEYGNAAGEEYLHWLVNLASEWKRSMMDDGSLVLNLGYTYEKGQPTFSTLPEQLVVALTQEVGLHLAQRYFYQNTAPLPTTHWVTVRRCRVVNAVESVFHFSKSPYPDADNRRVLKAYSSRMKKLIQRGGEVHRRSPGGQHTGRCGFSHDNGGKIPTNVIKANPSICDRNWSKSCREAGLPVHPARFSRELPEFFVQMLTQPGDTVFDPFAGSLTTASVCENLGRRWIGSERALTYLRGGHLRFSCCSGNA